MSRVAGTLEKSPLSLMESKKAKQKEMIKIILMFLHGNTPGKPSEAILHKEKLEFNDIELKQRSYK